MNLARLALNCCCSLRSRVIALEEGGGGASIEQWDIASAYSAGDVVFYLGDLYVASADTTGDDPTSGFPWTIIVEGDTGFLGFQFRFNTATSGDPGLGRILFNNATIASATSFNISEGDTDGNNLAAFFATWDDSTSTIRGTLLVKDPATPTNFAIFQITGAITDAGAYDTFSATYITGGGTFTNNLPVSVLFFPTGDAGTAGAAGATGAAGASADNSFHGIHEAPTNKTYTLVLYSNKAGTITALKAITVSGTLTVAVKINGTPVTGLSAVAVSSVLASAAASAANTFIIGDVISITVSSVASPVDFSWSILV